MANKQFGLADPQYDALRVSSNQALWAGSGDTGSTYSLNVREEDGDPSVDGVNAIVVDNGNLEWSSFAVGSFIAGQVRLISFDSTAIHQALPSEIAAMNEKVTPVNDDLLVIEDSEDGFNKKKLKVDNLPSGGGIPPGYFGDGSDGDVTISADTEIVGVYHFNNLTIDASKVFYVGVNGAPVIFVKDTLTINGEIRNKGEDGSAGYNNSGATGGAFPAAKQSGYQGLSAATPAAQGGKGGDAGQNGDIGDDVLIDVRCYHASTPQNGASGGAGAVGSPGAVGAGYDAGMPMHFGSDLNTALQFLSCFVRNTSSQPVVLMADSVNGGPSGGGGGAVKGGGGAGDSGGLGGNLAIIARHIVWSASGLIDCSGGDGGNGGNSDGDGGGGGGGPGGVGGVVILCYEDETGTRNVDVSGGTGGTGGTSVSAQAGANGPAGYAGVIIDLGL